MNYDPTLASSAARVEGGAWRLVLGERCLAFVSGGFRYEDAAEHIITAVSAVHATIRDI